MGRGRYLALWLLLLLGAILRLWGLKSFPLIEDEMTSFYEARGLWWDTHFEMGMMSRPLYFILLHPIVEAFPHSPVAWRILPFVFGILGIWATWRLARELVPDAPPWIAALLAATAPFLIYISGFGRYWSLIYFLSALTIGELSRAYRVQTAGAYLRALVPLVLGSLTHPTFLFPVVGVLLALHLFDQAGHVRWTWPGRKAWVWLYLPYLACMAGFGMILLARSEVGSLHNGPPRGTAALTRLVPTFIELIGPVTFVAALLGVLLLARGAARRSAWIIGIGFALGLTLLVGSGLSTEVYAYYGASLVPLLVVAAAQAVAPPPPDGGRATGAQVALTLLVASTLPQLASQLSDGSRWDNRALYDHIRRVAPDRALLTYPGVIIDYYAPELRVIHFGSRTMLDSTLAREGSAWVIVWRQRSIIGQDASGAVAGFLSTHCRLADATERARFDYRLYRSELYECTSGN